MCSSGLFFLLLLQTSHLGLLTELGSLPFVHFAYTVERDEQIPVAFRGRLGFNLAKSRMS
eukprot:1181927-Prorocentrum_minimum.AAC.4